MSPSEAYISRLAATSRRVVQNDVSILARELFPGVAHQVAPWHELTGDRAAAALAALGRTRAPNTLLRLRAVLRGVLRTAWRQGTMTTEALARASDLPKVTAKRVRRGRALSWPELDILVGACRGSAERAAVALMAGGGLRRAEVAAFRTRDAEELARRGGTLDIVVHGKGSRQRRQRLPRWAAELVLTWLDDPDVHSLAPGACFPWRAPAAVGALVPVIAARAGIGKVTAHDLRRTYASLYLASGGRIADLRRAMGHTRLDTTALYDCREDEEIREISARAMERPDRA